MPGKTATTLAAILLLLSGSAQAYANRPSQDDRTSPIGRLVMADPNYRRLSEAQGRPQVSGPEQPPTSLPNGADALKESYGDWAVECSIVEARKKCSVGQFQYDQQQRAVIFSIEVLPPEDGGYKIAVMMPFGLNLPDGIRLKLDDGSAEQRGSFATCLPNGCLVPLKFTDSSIEAMKVAKILKVSATAFGDRQNPTFNVSLKGFSSAIERLEDLQ